MRITDVRATYLNVPMKEMSPPAIGAETSAHHTLVVVEPDAQEKQQTERAH